ncbi:MAG: tetraacyldisaccharide 4'-kinase [Pseudomonadota bacterium]|nr:tetraacyldisaccharide 4'-kinase [Pseudomonadota bacterium]
MRHFIEQIVTRFWYQYSLARWVKWVFWPLQAIILKILASRYRNRELDRQQQPPVIVVGNITVGGTGKTPVVMALVKHFQEQGERVAVISRGYGAVQSQFPYELQKGDKPSQVGDEPALIAQQTNALVIIDPLRLRAYQKACEQGASVVIADDGLQHYALPRAYELVVVDSMRQFGNQQVLPLGPLREPMSRLAEVDTMLCTSPVSVDGSVDSDKVHKLSIMPQAFTHFMTGQQKPLAKFSTFAENQSCTAMCGIGNPERFIATLASVGVHAQLHALADHSAFDRADIENCQAELILITSKDAVKCAELRISDPRIWVLPIIAVLPEAVLADMKHKLPFDLDKNRHHEH